MTTIAELVERASRRFAERTAVVDGDRRLTFAEVGDRSSRLANALVGTLATARARGLRSSWATGSNSSRSTSPSREPGKVKVPINPRLTDAERRYMLSNCGADVLFTERSERERVESIRSELPGPRTRRRGRRARLVRRSSGERQPRSGRRSRSTRTIRA